LVKETLKCDIGLVKEAPLTEESWLSELVEVDEPPAPKRKRRKYRRYPKPVCTPEQKKALWEHQQRRCPICTEPVSLEEGVTDHSYRNSRNRGVLHRH
jgi:Recombination endonuclease VII